MCGQTASNPNPAAGADTMFKGDIAKFDPADLLSFLTHLKKEGVLSVTNGNEGLNITFKEGCVIDAHSEQADEKTLGALHMRGLVDADQYDDIRRARKDTGLPLLQILENIESFPVSDIGDILETGIREVLFQLFLWEAGQFQFAEIAVDPHVANRSYNCQNMTLDTAREVDEYREVVRTITSVDRTPVSTAEGRGAPEIAQLERLVVDQATGRNTVRSMVAAAPFPSYDVMKAVGTCVTEGWIEFSGNGKDAAATGNTSPTGRLFASYKRSLKKTVLSREVRSKVTEIAGFCKEHFDYSLVVASKGLDLVRGMGFVRDNQGQLQRSDYRDLETRQVRLDEDPIFQWVHQSRLPFFGKVFSSNFLERIGALPPAADGQCAIVPLGHVDNLDILIYVASASENQEPGPFQFLELLSWHVAPPPTDAERAVAPQPVAESETPPEPTPSIEERPADSDRELRRMVEAIKELPPMPSVVTRILQLLSDPNSKMSEITEVLSHDQALVARLIKVGNSAFYGRGQKTSTLSQAVVRMGSRAIRSLVLVATTRSLFPMDQTDVGLRGQALWQHAIECGFASRRVAELVGYADPEEAFVGGVLHDIGKVVILLSTPEEYRKIRRKEQNAGGVSSVGAETAVLGFDHTRVGELLLERWQMPQNLKACVRYHHTPNEAGALDVFASIVACGDYLSHTHGTQAGESRAEEFIDIAAIKDRLGLSEDHMLTLQEKIVEDIAHSSMLD